MRTPHTPTAIIYGLFGFVAGLILGAYATVARANPNPCAAVQSAYRIGAEHYKAQGLKDAGNLLYAHESAGIDLANEVAEAYRVRCFVKG